MTPAHEIGGILRSHALDWAAFEYLDRLRRLQGVSFDALGLGPVESHGENVFGEPGVSLKFNLRRNWQPAAKRRGSFDCPA